MIIQLVDDLKISHADKGVVEEIINNLNKNRGEQPADFKPRRITRISRYDTGLHNKR